MSVFGNYAMYYDLLYRDKDYKGETEYVHTLLQRSGANPKTILELGCGTGKHAMLLAEKGYSVTGVDQSEEMLLKARERMNESPRAQIQIQKGDIRNVRIAEHFDAVISLFHVISYQVTNDDLCAAFATARNHVKPGGIFIFDCWYGPAVLTDRPAVRIKRLEDERIQVTRIAEPVMHPNENVVDVNYTMFIQDIKNGSSERITENHTMRYLFKPEIQSYLKSAQFDLVGCEEWMTSKVPGYDTWGVVFIAKAIG